MPSSQIHRIPQLAVSAIGGKRRAFHTCACVIFHIILRFQYVLGTKGAFLVLREQSRFWVHKAIERIPLWYQSEAA
jgi:hypothetical protein